MRVSARLLAAAVLAIALPALSTQAAGPAKPAAGATVAMKVTSDGFEPDKVKATKGQPLTLVITRTTDKTCATEIVVKDYGINTPLPLNKPVSVTFTPTKAGQVRFACGMDMISGVVVVQ